MPSLLLPCPVHALTGLLCPGCGGTRCLLALLHGDLAAAWSHNALLTILFPLAVLLAASHVVARARDTPSLAERLTHAPAARWLLTLVVLAFTVARNLRP